MGAESDRVLKSRDAGGLIGGGTARGAGIHVSHAERTAAIAGRVKIRIEHATLRTKLQLEAIAFADLQRGIAELTDKLLRGEPEQAARLRLGGSHRHRLGLSHRLLRSCGAAGEDQRRGENEAAHALSCHCERSEAIHSWIAAAPSERNGDCLNEAARLGARFLERQPETPCPKHASTSSASAMPSSTSSQMRATNS